MFQPAYLRNAKATLSLLLCAHYLFYLRAHFGFSVLLFFLPVTIALQQNFLAFLPTTDFYWRHFGWFIIAIWVLQIVYRLARRSLILRELYPLGMGISWPTIWFGVRERTSLLVIEPLLALGLAVANVAYYLQDILPMFTPYYLLLLLHYVPELGQHLVQVYEGAARDVPVIQEKAVLIAAGYPFLAAFGLYVHNRYQYAATEAGMEEEAAKAPAQPYASGPTLTFAYGRRQKHRGFRSASAKDLSKGLGED